MDVTIKSPTETRKISLLIATAMGYEIQEDANKTGLMFWELPNMAGLTIDDFYPPCPMAYAWLVIKWANNQHQWLSRYSDIFSGEFITSMFFEDAFYLLSSAEAQTAWLDKAAELIAYDNKHGNG